ncbi:hypothetical protein RB620_28820 [Paenibacillus sp. LHD-117]|uniref:AlkZ-related protein n=1 Tax=Paenibacillus sp. LHD-117 TaxID=3071412 RepID=UPI0027DEC333|nr:hypothetical protein [Paenibacillus sp. LHD-117]MDQ6423424.1 hypothetical protein [Paenibacillus sp. LHD-117]
MEVSDYKEFVELVGQYKIFPFSGFVPDYPSLTAVTAETLWHTGADTDPWQWRVRIVQDGIAAYGKFFGDKACFIYKDQFPMVKTILTRNKTVEARYADGQLSRTARHIYQVLTEHGNLDSRSLRETTGLQAKEDKKEYEKALVELQNSGDVVITGAKASENDSGWNSMCYEPSDIWLRSAINGNGEMSVEDAKSLLRTELARTCSEKALAFFSKKLKLEALQ